MIKKQANYLENFNALSEHPFYSKDRTALPNEIVNACHLFLSNNAERTPQDVRAMINTMLMDKPKPLHWEVMCDLLLASTYEAVRACSRKEP